MKRFLAVLFSGYSIWATAEQQAPCVFWWSAPVEPGELVQLHGGAWDSNAVIELAGSKGNFAKARRLRPVLVTETGICFEYPRSCEADEPACCRVVNADGQASAPFVLNEPTVWWIQGDLGSDASPNGWLRVFGRCLSRGQNRGSFHPQRGLPQQLW